MVFRDHGLRLFLDKRLYMAFIKLQADKHLGRSFGGLLAFVEGLHAMGYLGDRDYENYRKRYSTPLDRDPQQVALAEVEEAKRRKDLNRMFSQVIAQYDVHKDREGWVDHWRERALKNGELFQAKKLLALIEERRST